MFASSGLVLPLVAYETASRPICRITTGPGRRHLRGPGGASGGARDSGEASGCGFGSRQREMRIVASAALLF